MYDDDFSDFTGMQADLNGDGEVDLTEYLNDQDDFEHMFESDDDTLEDDDDISDDDCDTDESDDFDDDENGTYDEEDENDINITFSLSFGGSDDQDDADCNDSSKFDDCTQIEKRYYDVESQYYCIGRAVHANFKEVADNFSVEETVDINTVIHKIYTSNRKFGMDILIWIIENFPKALAGAACESYNGGFHSEFVIDSMIYNDGNNYGDDFTLHYIYEHPEFEQKVLGNQFVNTRCQWLDEFYLPYLIITDDIERFIRAYNCFLNNPNLNTQEYPKDKFIEDVIFHIYVRGIRNANQRIYTFLHNEIDSIGKPIKIKYLMCKLNEEFYGEPLFEKPVIDQKITEESELEIVGNRLSELEQQKEDYLDKIDEIDKEIKKLRLEHTRLNRLARPSPIPHTKPYCNSDTFYSSLAVMGSQFYDEKTVNNVAVGDELQLLPEPSNEYDSNAIVILDRNGNKLGYVSRLISKSMTQDLKKYKMYGIVSQAKTKSEFNIYADVWIKD